MKPAVRIAFLATFLFALNAFLCRELFLLEYLKYMHSNEGAFIALGRVLREHPGEIQWWPFWNAGMPYTHTYFPLLAGMTAALSAASGLGAAAAFHTVCALFYCLGPVTLFLMAWRLSGAVWPSAAAALGYSLLSPSALLVPAIGIDMGSLWHARRLHALVYYGESPHVVALTLAPLAVLFLWWSLRGRRPVALVAGLLVSSVLLANAFGTATLALAVLCLFLAESEVPWRKRLLVLAGICAIAVLWVSPWMPPSLVASIRMNSPTAGGDFRPTLASRAAALLLPAALLLVWLAVRRLPFHLRFAALFGLLSIGIPLLAFHTQVNVVPQGTRYQLELEMGFWLLAAFATAYLTRDWPRTWRTAGVVLLLVAAGVQVVQYRRFARQLIQPHPGVTRTIEYRTARWMDDHFRGQRVMVSGSSAFWFNTFTDNPQLSGGNDATAPNWLERVAVYIIYSGEGTGARDGEIAVIWLKAFGAQAIAVPGPASEEAYKPFRNPRKFEGLLPVLWREGADTVYGVPHRSASLAHVIPEAAAVTRAPAHGVDVDPILPYVAALDDPSLPLAEFRWRTRHSAVIHTRATPDQLLSVQTTYHPGWRATVNGTPRETFGDGLGMLVIRPQCSGPCEVELVFDGGTEREVALALSALVSLGVLAWVAVPWWRRRPGPR